MPETVMRSVLIAVLFIVGVMMLRPVADREPRVPSKAHWWIWHREFHGERYSVNLPVVLTATSIIGLLSGMLGITGGVIKLPIMVLLCGVPMDIAVATSTVMVAITALSGIAGHAVKGEVDWRTGLMLAVAAVIGGLIGSRISVRINKHRLKMAFGVAVLLIACRMSFKLFGL
jgi:uncharacterized membrane protein YfcA